MLWKPRATDDWKQTFEGEVTAGKRLRAFTMWLRLQLRSGELNYAEMDLDTGLFIYAVSGKNQFLKTVLAETERQTRPISQRVNAIVGD